MSDVNGMPIKFAVMDTEPRTDWPPMTSEDIDLATHLFGADFAQELAEEFGTTPAAGTPAQQRAQEKSA